MTHFPAATEVFLPLSALTALTADVNVGDLCVISLLLLWLCGGKAMNDAMRHAEDAMTRFVKSSTRLARPAEVEKKRVDLMVRELLTIRPYSAPSQIKIRSVIFCKHRRK